MVLLRSGALLVALIAGSAAWAQGAAPAPVAAGPTPAFPGGATSVRESHGDWVVSCGVNAAKKKVCAVSQQLAQQAKGGAAQRVMTIELSPGAKGAEGALLLPFGLLLAKGAALQIDDARPQAPAAIRTCLPAGCVAPLNIEAAQINNMRKAKQLKVNLVAADSEKPVVLAASLKGFGDALDRAALLLK